MREYVAGVEMKENGNTYYYIMDRLGNVRYVLNESGAIVKSYLYTPFGQIHTSSGSLSNPYQYVGGEGYYTEQDINLQLLGQRWYDAETGRFISRDPIGEEGGLNLYGYVRNNCVNGVDPYGDKVECVGGDISGGVVFIIGRIWGNSLYTCHGENECESCNWIVSIIYSCWCVGYSIGGSIEVGKCVAENIEDVASGSFYMATGGVCPLSGTYSRTKRIRCPFSGIGGGIGYGALCRCTITESIVVKK